MSVIVRREALTENVSTHGARASFQAIPGKLNDRFELVVPAGGISEARARE